MTAIELRPSGPARVGQATAIEQSRAVAEVHAAIVVAQQVKRSTPEAIIAMEEACQQPAMANRAFFRYPRGGETVSGPSVHLARELARCWGNIQYGITELDRDDSHGQSQMQAWAWDVQTNTRSSNTFIVPHKRDTKRGSFDLTDARDIYENNANNGARRLREAVFAVLPVWFREQAIGICTQTIENGGGKPLAQRIADAVKAFEALRVTPGRIAAKFGHGDVSELTAHDVGQLGVIYDSIRQGTVTVDDEFPAEQDRVTAADILGGPQTASPATPASRAPEPQPAPPAEQDAGEAPASERQQKLVGAVQGHMKRLGFAVDDGDREDRMNVLAKLAEVSRTGSDWYQSTSDFDEDELSTIADKLAKCRNRDALKALLSDGEVPSE